MPSSIVDRVAGKLRRLRNRFIPVDIADLGVGPHKLHLGCGGVHLDGWVNIDGSRDSTADLVCDFKVVGSLFKEGSVEEVLMVHSISYLRLWEARIFLKEIHQLLQPGGKIVFEFPDVEKCSKVILDAQQDPEKYMEGVRALYAFDLTQIEKREAYHPYTFGWSAWHLLTELRALGFRDFVISEPLTHGNRNWRDSRVEATK